MAKKPLQKYCIQQVSPLQDGYVELTLAIVPEEQAGRLDYLVQTIKVVQKDFERIIKEAVAQGKDINYEAYEAANKKASRFKSEYDSILCNLEKGKRKTYWAQKGEYKKGEILDRLPSGAMLIK